MTTYDNLRWPCRATASAALFMEKTYENSCILRTCSTRLFLSVSLVMACYLQAKPCVITVSHLGNLLLPRPGFPLYQVLCRGLNICFSCYRYGVNEKFSPNCWQNRLVYHEFMVWNRWNHAGDYHGVEVRYYDLLPDQGWQCNIGDIAKLVVWVPVSSKNFTCHCRIRKNPMICQDDNTCGLLINNPSNPCGTVFPREHLAEVLKAATELGLPVIADEVYAGMSFSRTADLEFQKELLNIF